MRAALISVVCFVAGCSPPPDSVLAPAPTSPPRPALRNDANHPELRSARAMVTVRDEAAAKSAAQPGRADISVSESAGTFTGLDEQLRALQASLGSCAHRIPHHRFFKEHVVVTLQVDAGGVRSAVATGRDVERTTLDCVENRAREARLVASRGGKLVLEVELSNPGED